MASDAENRHAELLRELDKTRERVVELEKAVLVSARECLESASSNASTKGRDQGAMVQGKTLIEKIGLIEGEADMSDYLGSDMDAYRPGLGADAPRELLPDEAPRLDGSIMDMATEQADDVFFGPVPEESFFQSPSTHGLASQGVFADDTVSQGLAGLLQEGEGDLEAGVESGIEEGAGNGEVFSSLALDMNHIGVWQWDMVTGEVTETENWKEIVGFSPCCRVTPLKPLLEKMHPADAVTFREAIDSILRGLSNGLRLIVRIPLPDQMDSWVDFRVSCLRDSQKMHVHTLVLTASDVTESRKTELALRASREKFRILAEGSPDFIGRFDREGHFIYASQSIGNYVGMLPSEVVGHTFCELFSCADASFFSDNLSQVFEIGIPIQAESVFSSQVMGYFAADCRFWPEISEGGITGAVTMQVWDMTTSHRMAENYHALFNSMVDGLALFKCHSFADIQEGRPGEFRLMAMNPALGKMLDLDPERSTGKKLEEITGADFEQWNMCLEQVILNKKPVVYCLRCVDRGILLELSTYSPGPGRVACIVKDITQLHTIKQTAHLNEARFAALYRLSHMYAAPEEEVVRFSLDQAAQLTGSSFGYLRILQGPSGFRNQSFWSRDEGFSPLNREMPDMSPELQNILEADLASFRAEIRNSVKDVWVRMKEGQQVPISRYILAPVIEDGRIVCIAGVANKGQAYERSDLRQLELFVNGMWFHLRRRWAIEALQQAKELAEGANRAKNIFLANVSHELRTPLNGILGMLQLLQGSELTAEQREWMEVALYSGQSLLHIISDILNFSRIEAGRYDVVLRPFDLVATIRSTLGIFLNEARQKGIHFTLNIDERLPLTLVGDEGLVRQTVLNIVGNAFKFTSCGGITVNCSALSPTAIGCCRIYLTVQDTGIGIAEEDIATVFRPFTQIDGSHTRRYGGVGLGLSIVQRLVGVMGGSLCLDSEPGEGTTVYIVLPFKPYVPSLVDTGALSAAMQEERALQGSFRPLDILVAEDDPVNRLTIRSMLKKAGHQVVCVEDGQEAIEALQLHPFDCLITDIQMPVLDGEEVVCRIRTGRMGSIRPGEKVTEIIEREKGSYSLRPVPSDLPIIALTAHVMASTQEHLLALGMDYHLTKPLDNKELLKTLARVSYYCLDAT